MNYIIHNPYKLNHRLYIKIILIALAVIIPMIFIPKINCYVLANTLEVIKNLAYGSTASTLVSWLIDYSNTKRANEKANETYDAVYLDLKVNLIQYICLWAKMCAIAFKDADYYEESHTWLQWYQITKENFKTCSEKRQKELFTYFGEQLSNTVNCVRESLNKIISQQHLLTINDAMNNDMHQIIADFDFEFRACDIDLFLIDNGKDFWRHFDAINSDLIKYIGNWSDIKYYNYNEFNPRNFLDKDNLRIAIAKSIIEEN